MDFQNAKTREPSSKKSRRFRQSDNDPFDFNLNEIIGAIGTETRISNYHVNGRDSTIEKGTIPSDRRSSRLDYRIPQSAMRKTTLQPQIEVEQMENNLTNSILTAETSKNPLSVRSLEENTLEALNIPIEWTKFINEQINTSLSLSNENKNLKTTISSRRWIQSLLSLINLNTNDESPIIHEAIDHFENNLSSNHFIFLQKCCFTLGIIEKNIVANFNSQSIHKFFHGHLPWSPVNEKIEKNFPELTNLLVKAFR